MTCLDEASCCLVFCPRLLYYWEWTLSGFCLNECTILASINLTRACSWNWTGISIFLLGDLFFCFIDFFFCLYHSFLALMPMFWNAWISWVCILSCWLCLHLFCNNFVHFLFDGLLTNEGHVSIIVFWVLFFFIDTLSLALNSGCLYFFKWFFQKLCVIAFKMGVAVFSYIVMKFFQYFVVLQIFWLWSLIDGKFMIVITHCWYLFIVVLLLCLLGWQYPILPLEMQCITLYSEACLNGFYL